MDRKKISVLLVFFFVFFLVGCNSEAIYQEALIALESEDFTVLNTSYEKLEKKDKELSTQVEQKFEKHIEKIYTASTDDDKYQNGYDLIKSIETQVPLLRKITIKGLKTLEDAFKEKVDTIYSSHLDLGEFDLSVSEIEAIKPLFPSLSAYIDQKISNLDNDVEVISETICLDSIKKGSYPSAISFYKNLSIKVPSLSIFAQEKIEYFEELLPSKTLYEEGIGLIAENDYKNAIKKFEAVIANAQYYYEEAQNQLANVSEGLFNQLKLEIVSAMQNLNFNKISEIIALMNKYDEDKSTDLEDSISLLLTQSVEALKEKGEYSIAKTMLAKTKSALPSLFDDTAHMLDNINTLLPSMSNYKRGLSFFNAQDYTNALSYFDKILGNATYYYSLASSKTHTAKTNLYNQYLNLAKTNFSKKDIKESVENINTAISYVNSVEAKSLKTQYETELAKYMEPYEIIDKLEKSIVTVCSYNSDGIMINQGSGFVVSSDGKILTNYNVIAEADSVSVSFKNRIKYGVQKIYKYSSDTNYAVIQISKTGLKPLDIGDSQDINNGESVVVISSSEGLNNIITEGVISYINRIFKGNSYIQTSASITSESSGGALLNMKGELIGITTVSLVAGKYLNLAVPINIIDSHINSTTSQDFSQFANRVEFVDEYFSIKNETVHYKGTMSKGKFHGEGKLTWLTGTYYEGDFVDGYFNGDGVYHTLLGMAYEGEFEYDKFHGNGSQTFSNGAVITGIWYQGEYLGQEDSPRGLKAQQSTKRGHLFLQWDNDSYDLYNIYYSYDLNTWERLGSENTQYGVPNPSEGSLFKGFPNDRIFYVCIEGANFDETTSGKSNYDIAWCYFTKIDVYSGDGENRFLGELNSNINAPNSIFRTSNDYGSANYEYSIWNQNGIYGDLSSDSSANSSRAKFPPKLVNENGDLIGYITNDLDFKKYNPEVIVTSPTDLFDLAENMGLE